MPRACRKSEPLEEPETHTTSVSSSITTDGSPGPHSRKLELRIPAAFSQLFQSELDWALRTAPQPGLDGREVFFPLGRTLGGSSASTR